MNKIFFNIIISIFLTSSSLYACTGNCYEPVANAGGNARYYQGINVNLDGSGSFDPDNQNTELSYLWSVPSSIILSDSLSSAPSFNAPSIPFVLGCSSDTYSSEEDCIAADEIWSTEFESYIPINLTVNDGEYDSAPDKIIITILATNTPPVLDIATDFTVTKEFEMLIDASSADDSNSLTGQLSFSWTLNDNDGFSMIEGIDSPVLKFTTPNTGGNYTIDLFIDDGYVDGSLTVSFNIDVIDNRAPVPVISKLGADANPGSDIEVGAGEVFTLTAANSFDYDNPNELFTYQWNVNAPCNTESNINSEEIIINAPSSSGVSCDISLTLTDSQGLQSNLFSGTGLFFSEIAEASSGSNNYVEIFNGTSSQVNLSEYSIKIYRNNGTIYNLALDDESGASINDGFLDAGSTIVIVDNDTGDLCGPNDPYLQCTENNIQFIEYTRISDLNGDDVIELYHNDDLIDTFGEAASAGTEFDIAGVDEGSKNHTLVRKPFVLSGNTDWPSSAGASDASLSEWLVYEVNTFIYGGSHFNTFCDNSISVLTVENLPPTVSLTSNQAGQELVVGGSVTLNLSLIDPEGELITNGDYQILTVNPNHQQFLDIDINDFSTSDGICVDALGDFDGGCNNNSDCSSGFSCDEDSGIYEVAIEVIIEILDGFDISENLEFQLIGNDGVNDDVVDTISFNIAQSNSAPVVDFTVSLNCDDSSLNQNPLLSESGVYQVFENCNVIVDLSSSSDNTSTGTFSYLWDVLPVLDLDNDGTNDLNLSPNTAGGFSSTSTTNILTIQTPSNISENKTFDCSFYLSDGIDESTVTELDFNISASMPIVTDITQNNNYYEFSEQLGFEIQGSGFLYEGMIVRLESSAFDPDGDQSDLDYSWSANPIQVSTNDGNVQLTPNFVSYCDDLAGNIDTVPCISNDDCQMCSDPQFDNQADCTTNDDGSATGNIWGGGCLESNNTSISYLQLPVHVQEDVNFSVELQVSDLSNQVSNIFEYTIPVIARNPVANSGFDIEAVVGETVTLNGYLSYDNQESEAYVGTYTELGGWDDSVTKIIAMYNNQVLEPVDGYLFEWSQVDSEGNSLNDILLSSPNGVNPTFTAPNAPTSLFFNLRVTDPQGNQSQFDNVEVSVIADESPVILSNCSNGEFISSEECTTNQFGNPTGNTWGGDFRASAGSRVYLKNMNFLDNTVKGDYTFEWSSQDVVVQNPTSNNAFFDAPAVPYGEETTFEFTYTLTNLTGGSQDYILSESLNVVLANLSTPVAPKIDAYPEDGQITLFWDNISELELDSLTQYADFQGYKLYKSDDYGQTWGDDDDVILSETGDTLGWQPFLIVDYDEDQDLTYCLYNSTNDDCEKVRGLEISGADPFQSWFSLGTNTGLVQSFVDTNVINGIDYTYTITAFDRGLRGSIQSFGSYNDLTGEWEEQSDHSFTEFMPASYYEFNRLEYTILNSYFDESGTYVYQLEVPDGSPSEFSKVDILDLWPSTNPDQYYTNLDENGNKLGYKAMESLKGQSVSDHNYIQVTPGHAASNVTFPSLEDLDDFLNRDCRSIGNSTKNYEIVNLDSIKNSFVKFEIEAKSNSETFEGYASDDACLYAYRVIQDPNQGPNERTKYVPADVSVVDGLYSFVPTPYQELDESNESLIGLPGVMVDSTSNPISILIPNYVDGIECFELEYLDDPDYLNNYTPAVDGIRVRFDNLLKNFPSSGNARLYDAKSEPDESLVNSVLTDVAAGGSINLEYYTSFNKKPSYDYEIELSDSYVSATLSPGSECLQDVEYQLPFKVKNLTTNKYVQLKHNDNGIFNGNRPPWYVPPIDDPDHDPGAGDCMWQPGELIYFERDSVAVGTQDDLEVDAEKTYALNITYSMGQLISRNNLCDSYTIFSEVASYQAGNCVYDEGQLWYARTSTSPALDGYEPSMWIFDDSDSDYFNANPWVPIYPWGENAGGATKITLETQKWYVDGDYWVVDMSMLGKENEVVEADMNKINVVPNPYIVYSSYNRTPNSLRFTYLPTQCSIKIFTVSGELVKTLFHNNPYDGDHFWDLKSESGKIISPGLYIYVVKEKDSGLEKVGKFAVVR